MGLINDETNKHNLLKMKSESPKSYTSEIYESDISTINTEE